MTVLGESVEHRNYAVGSPAAGVINGPTQPDSRLTPRGTESGVLPEP